MTLISRLQSLFADFGEMRGENWRTFVRFLEKRDITCFHSKFSARYLKTLDFSISTLVDVGVDQGTPALYDAFPGAKIVLVDPLSECIEEVTRGLAQEKGRQVVSLNIAAGDNTDSNVMLMVPASCRGHASIVGWLDGDRELVESRLVNVKRVDDEVLSLQLGGPYGIKIDVEGALLPALRGCSGLLRDTAFLILEVDSKKNYKNQATVSTIFGELAAAGFELFDILNPAGRPSTFFDMLFIPANDSRFLT